MGYYVLPHGEPIQACVERLTFTQAVKRWLTEIQWAAATIENGLHPIHVALLPAGKFYELHSLSLWPADGVR